MLLILRKIPNHTYNQQHPKRQDYRDERNGTANLFILCEPIAGWRHLLVTQRRTAVDYALKLKDACRYSLHRCKRIRYLSIFGVIEIPSPYLWDKNEAKGARPVKEQLGIEHGDLSRVVQRAMTDFGAEESFGQAAKRFEEH